MFLHVCSQLLSVPAPRGRCGLEDQAELLGVTAARGKTLTYSFLLLWLGTEKMFKRIAACMCFRCIKVALPAFCSM